MAMGSTVSLHVAPRDAAFEPVDVPAAPNRAKSHEKGITQRLEAGHVPALDGVRGLAIFLVLLFHFVVIGGNTPTVRIIQKTWGFGWAGVDLFFVLSGFLITRILLDAKKRQATAGGYFKNFYARRTVRIFPLYYAFLLLFLIILPRTVPGFAQLFGTPPGSQWIYWTYTYNLFQGHHNPATFSHSVGVIWSLCIEEQFYLIWPTVVWFSKPKTLLKVCAGLLVMSMGARLIVSMVSGYEVYISQWSFCRMDPLAIGAALAILTRIDPDLIQRVRRPARHLIWLVPIAILGMNVVFGSLTKSTVFHIVGYSALAILFGSVLLMTITAPAGAFITRFFSNSLLRLFGRLSYAMYLVNQPIKYALLRYVYGFEDPGNAQMTSVSAQMIFFVFAAVLTVAVAWLSWHLFEKHFLRLKKFFPMTRPAPEGQRDPLAASPIVLPP
ncbi:acyltransferase [soil metagenome]